MSREFRIASVVSVSGDQCGITFDGVVVIKPVPVIGEAARLSIGDKVYTQIIQGKVFVVTGTGEHDVFVSPHEEIGAVVAHAMSTHTDEEEWFLSMIESYGSGTGINNIVLFSSEITIYDLDDSGMSGAVSASASGDTILVPPVVLTENYTIKAGVTVSGMSIEDTVFTGQLILSDGSALENLSIVRSKNQVGAVYGIIEGAGAITATVRNVKVNVQNAGGPAYALYMANGGTIRVTDSELLAEVGTDGYAAYIASGTLYQYGGRAIGSTALYPYFL